MLNVASINNNTSYTYENNGGLAQLGERLNGIQKVRGSNPLSSTILSVVNKQLTTFNTPKTQSLDSHQNEI